MGKKLYVGVWVASGRVKKLRVLLGNDGLVPMSGVALSTETKSPADAAMLRSARERYESALQRYALRQMGGTAAPASEILAGIWKDLQAQSAAEIGPQAGEWLFLNCRRRILAMQSNGPTKHLDTGGAEKEVGAAVNPAEAGENEEPHVTMQRAIDRLTPKQQEVVRLRFQNDFSVQEIARITELTAYNVGALVHNAVARLGREYQAHHPDEAGGEKKGVGDDSRLTLYALGEMEDAEQRSFEDSLIDKKNAAVRVAEIRAIGALIGQTLAIEAGGPAPHTVRKKKRSGLALWLGFPRVLLPVGGLLVVGVLIFFWITKPEVVASGGARERIDFRLKPANWKDGDALPDAESYKVGAGPAGAARPKAQSLSRAGAKYAPRPPVRAASGHLADVVEGEGEDHAQYSAGRTSRENEVFDDGENVQHGGVPTGALPTGVTAVLRGKSGDKQTVAKGISAGEADEIPLVPGDVPEKGEEESAGAADPRQEEATSPGKQAGHSQPKTPVVSEKKRSERKEREFALAKDAGISRLPPDVEATSVGVLKRKLWSGRRPSPKSVKVEELLNHFPIASAAPQGSELFAATLESAEAPWNPHRRLVRVSLRGKDAPKPVRGPASLVLLVDISGSMAAPNRLPLVKDALRLLLGRLQPDDLVGVVTYAAEPRLALLPTPVAQTQEILRVVERLEAQGPTNGGAGMELAYDLAKAHGVPGGRNCVIMCTDGNFNSGPTREEELAKIIDQQSGSGVTLSIYGFGRGRQIDARLEKLAQRGGGSSGYVNTRRDAEQVLTAEINGIFLPLAKNLEVKVTFNPDQVESYRLLGYDEPTEAAQEKATAAPENKTVLPGHTITALYEVVPAQAATAGVPIGDLLKVRLNYQTPGDGLPHQQDFTLRDRGTKFADAGLDFKFAAAVGAFGLVLSERAPNGMTLEGVEAWAKECLGADEGGYRSEFLALVEQARAIQE